MQNFGGQTRWIRMEESKILNDELLSLWAIEQKIPVYVMI